MSDGIRAMWMRGGTSKGGYFIASDLPRDQKERDALLLRIMGSPDPTHPPSMLADYLPVLIFIAVAGGLGLLLLALGYVFAPRRPDPEKTSAYECGFEAFSDTRGQFVGRAPRIDNDQHTLAAHGQVRFVVEPK